MKRCSFVLLALGLVLFSLPLADAGQFPFSDAPAQSSVRAQAVRFLFPEQVTIASGKPASVDLHFRVEQGLHINSHTPREAEMIPTELTIPETPGVKVKGIDFPPGADYSPSFNPKAKLSVYSGEFALKIKVEATPGDHLLQGKLRYQACDVNLCYPPRTIPVVIDLQVK